MNQQREHLSPAYLLRVNTKISLAILLFILVGVVQADQNNVLYCSSVFVNGVQTHAEENSLIQFDYNARLINASSQLLHADSVQTDPWSQYKSCGTSACMGLGQTAQKLYKEIPSEPDSELDILIPPKEKMILGSDNNQHFGLVKISESAVALFSSTHNQYRIDRLYVGFKATLQLPAGEYWIKDLQMEAASRIEVIGPGTVSLYFSNSILIPFKASINENTGDPSKLGIYVAGPAHFDVGSRSYAFVSAGAEFRLGHSAKITGGVAADAIFLQSESEITYDLQAAQRINFGDLCVQDSLLNQDKTPPELQLDGEFLFEYLWNLQDDQATIWGTVMDVGDYASGVARVDIITEHNGVFSSTDVSGNWFFINATLVVGVNRLVAVATDMAGNQSVLEFEMEYGSTPAIKNILFSQSPIVQPDLVITGEIHTKWLLDEILFIVDDTPWPITKVSEGIYSFEISYTLTQPSHKLVLLVESPAGEPVIENIDISWDAPP